MSQHIDEGLSAWAIGKELEVPTAEVRATLERFGLERPPVNPHLTADALRTAFAEGATGKSIAQIAGVDRLTVRRALRRHGIENPRSNSNRRPAELDDAEWVRARYVGDRMSIRAIAVELGVESNTVGRALKRHDVPRRRRADRPGGIDPEWLRKRYVDDGVTMAEIARDAGVSHTTVRRAMAHYGVSRR